MTLSVDAARFQGPVSFNTRLYDASFPGPTLRIKPGDNVRVLLRNLLGPNIDQDTYTDNTLHTPNTTNLHTHGLHISPHMPHDDVLMMSVEPGQENAYFYEILSEHYPGSFFYHPHDHGSTFVQVCL